MDDYMDYIEIDFAMDRHWGSDEDYDNGYERFGPIRTESKTCRHCNKNNLHWGLHGDKWRLFDENNKLHTCIEYNANSSLQEGKV